MEYIVKRTDILIGWLKKVKDSKTRARLIIRTNREAREILAQIKE